MQQPPPSARPPPEFIGAARRLRRRVGTWLVAGLAGPAAAQSEPPADPPLASPWPAVLEIVSFDFALSRYNHAFSGSRDYDVSWGTVRRNLRGPWVTDGDPFKVNQFAHPYQGAMYHAAGRSTGLDYWQSSALTFAGSAWWEITGEKTPPSRNDQVASGIAGSFLGEPLFRMARLVAERSDLPAALRPWLAAAVSPAVGFNRLAYGARFDGSFSDHDPAYYGRMHLGLTHVTNDDVDRSAGGRQGAAQVDFALDYGLPGQPGYTYTRPFDYFNFQALFSGANGVENLGTRGLLYGRAYAAGADGRGIWGLYANYDYLAPQIFHVSTTSLSLGTTGQWWASQSVALQGTALAGFGYSAVSTARRVADNPEYHYGMAARVALALRLIADDRASLDVSARMVSLGTLTQRASGRDDISRIDSALTWRVHGSHAVGINYVWSHRSADFAATAARKQTLGRVGLYYTLLGQGGFGAVDWRAPAAD